MAGDEPELKKQKLMDSKVVDAWMYYHLKLKKIKERKLSRQITEPAENEEVRLRLNAIRHEINYVQNQRLLLDGLESQSVFSSMPDDSAGQSMSWE